ncbi:MAG: hypothetical protein U0401_16945 [Anaerolineae bacterium]
MSTRILTVDEEPRWLGLAAETIHQIKDIYLRIVDQRSLSLWQRYEICCKNLSRLEIQRSQGQEDVQIHNQIETIKQEIAEIELEMKGEEGILCQVYRLFSESLQLSEEFGELG